ncbi:MAG: hypothetical protein ACI9LT_002794 [Pseudoalteromonas distincta]|jgi:hypothetical protein
MSIGSGRAAGGDLQHATVERLKLEMSSDHVQYGLTGI